MKLHVGSGGHCLEGWINADLAPQGAEIYLDATKPFPWASDTFSHIFTEHMIEHITFDEGAAMLRECYRVLEPGGRIRVSTPDFQLLAILHAEGDRPDAPYWPYVEWATREFGLGDKPSVMRVINNFVRAWGHQFIYDQRTLGELVREIGFDDVCFWAIHESDDPDLRNLENSSRMPAGFLQLETMTLETTKLVDMSKQT